MRAIFALILRRLVELVPVCLGITLGAFFLLRLIPGDPAVEILQFRATPELIAKLHAEFGLDRSILEQYVLFLGRLLHGDLGTSYNLRQPVAHLIAQQLLPTLALVTLATCFSSVLAFPLALIAALRRGSSWDRMIRALIITSVSVPSYWVGLILLLLFAVTIPLFPVGGYGQNFIEHLHHLVLPSLTLALMAVPILLRALRTSLLESLGSDHVLMARAKGLPEFVVLYRHVLRNALIPTVTLLGVNASWLMGATVLVEIIFGIPGLGQLLSGAIAQRDYPTVQAVTMVYAVLAVFTQLITDVSIMVLDPRVRGKVA
jgi:peptide/nickel transport system permease protein